VPHDAWTAFGVGVLGGVVGGLSLLTFVGIFAVSVIAITGGLGVRPRPFGAAGILVGWGAAWVLALGAAQSRCEPASCVGPDLTPWLTTAATLVGIGVVLLALGIVRPPWMAGLAVAGSRIVRRRSVRFVSAMVFGLVAAWYASSLLLAGWATTILVACWFAWTHRGRERRAEIGWFALASVVIFVLLVPR
jgi:hypothetical protein